MKVVLCKAVDAFVSIHTIDSEDASYPDSDLTFTKLQSILAKVEQIVTLGQGVSTATCLDASTLSKFKRVCRDIFKGTQGAIPAGTGTANEAPALSVIELTALSCSVAKSQISLASNLH
jgi:hypothetical protein